MPMFSVKTPARAAGGDARRLQLFFEEALATLGFMAAITTALVVVFGTLEPERVNLLTHVSFALLTLGLFGLEVTVYQHLHPDSPARDQ
ncbi:MAG: hypothetical protein CFK52_13360 [Chloracidobacterium sp. CP2_5A]|nr:MAG: hypothetical protein CFK52_13360 [Chloracidobacterium sp. CP2_5A]